MTCFELKYLNSIQKTKQQVHGCVKYFNFVQKKRKDMGILKVGAIFYASIICKQ